MTGRISRPLLLPAMLVLLGHVCAGSPATLAHLLAPPTAESADDGHVSLHAASCDAAVDATTVPAIAPVADDTGWEAAPGVSSAVRDAAPQPVPHPPRFLLHAALRV
jgi:hypothetical protein